MIPKIIHYCWFGRNPKPKLAKKCIRSWKKYCHGFEIREWNEDNYDISSAPRYVQEAYQSKKWAFVTDYVRLQVVNEYGGIYLDTDVEIIRPFPNLLNYSSFFCMQTVPIIATGLGFGSEKNNEILKELMGQYSNIPFILGEGKFDLLDCPTRNLPVFQNHGFVKENKIQMLENDVCVLPSEYFCPLDWGTKKMNKTANTYAIHWFSASWWDEKTRNEHRQKRKQDIKNRRISHLKQMVRKVFGEKAYSAIKNKLKK